MRLVDDLTAGESEPVKPSLEDLGLTQKQLEAMRSGHFGTVPAVAILNVGLGQFASYPSKGDQVIYQGIGKPLQVPAEGYFTGKMQVNDDEKKIRVGAWANGELSDSSQVNFRKSSELPELIQVGNLPHSLQPDPSRLPLHKAAWDLVDSNTAVLASAESYTGATLQGRSSLKLESSALQFQAEADGIPAVYLLEMAAQNTAAALMPEGKTPMFSELSFAFDKGDFSVAPESEIDYVFRLSEDARQVVLAIDFLCPDTGERLFTAAGKARIVHLQMMQRFLR